MRVAASIAHVAVLVVACTLGTPQPSGTDVAGGICHLVPLSQIEQIVGRPALVLPGERSCGWLFEDPMEQVSIELAGPERFAQAEDLLNDKQVESGLGDAALWFPETSDLYVRSGPRTLVVTTFGISSDWPRRREFAIGIAREAISRLP